jgi:Tannase and feruloyl esterase
MSSQFVFCATGKAPVGVTLAVESVAAQNIFPAFCKVTGKMNECIGVNGKGELTPYHIGFEMRLPVNWNGRLLYQGGGGNDGVIRPAVGSQATAEKPALSRGFADKGSGNIEQAANFSCQ